ncbi:MAG TPA: MBL fold metallo-hydrolase, partial [Xanthobacteraceae bacterium]|nr:MBL fold metallo-hydrolase [Xanthobacteraceae bacterium]
MSVLAQSTALTFPYPTPPEPGSVLEIAPGILWLRLALPYRLDHVNVYLIEDGAGWAVLDTGLDDAVTRAAWDMLLNRTLHGRALTRVLVTHYHPDHIGLAGWLCERFGLPLLMSQTEYLVSLSIHLEPGALNAEPYRSFYRSHGLDSETTERLLTSGHRYLRMISGLPRTFRRLIAGESLRIGGRTFEVLSGGGHAPEQVMLFCPAENLLLCADQVLARISPNISVQAMDPEGDPLGIYLRSLASLKRDMPEDVLVLPGHNLPFVGLGTRIDELCAHHEARCVAIETACRRAPCTAA